MDNADAIFSPEMDFLQYSLDHPQRWQQQTLTVQRGVTLELYAPGVVMLKPAKLVEGYRAIVLSCGIHGNETAPIEICQRLLRSVIDGEQELHHPLLIIFGNLTAIDQGCRFIDINLNRLFDTKAALVPVEGHDEIARARQLELAIEHFYDHFPKAQRLHYDLHTAIRDSIHPKFAINPFGQESPVALQRLSYLGIATVLLAEQPTSTFSYASWKRYGAESFTVELGKVHPFGENDPKDYSRFEQGLSVLCGQTDWEICETSQMPQLFQVTRTLNKQFDDFRFNFSEKQANFSTFEAGTEIAREGNLVHSAVADEAIVFPNANVPIGQRTLLLVRQIGLDAFADKG